MYTVKSYEESGKVLLDSELAWKASREDAVLLKSLKTMQALFLKRVAKKWRFRNIQPFGLIVSEISLINAVSTDADNFSKTKGSVPGFKWNSARNIFGRTDIDDRTYTRMSQRIEEVFSPQVYTGIAETEYQTQLDHLLIALKEEGKVDLVQEATRTVYRILWKAVGLSEARLTESHLGIAIKTLRSVSQETETSKALSKNEVETAHARLLFLEELSKEAFQTSTNNRNIIGLLKEEGFDEETAVTVVNDLMTVDAEKIIRLLPRMAALFIKTGYLDYLVEHPEHISIGVDEAKRVIARDIVTMFCAKQEVTIQDMHVPEGTQLILSTMAASSRFGDFNPFREDLVSSQTLWDTPDFYDTAIGVNLAEAVINYFIQLLLEIHTGNPLTVIDQISDDKNRLGSFKQLTVSTL
jgi:hypothetical protein